MMILKIGGGAKIHLAAIADEIAKLTEPLIVVHGANALRGQLAGELGYAVRTVTSVSGYTSVFTDDTAIDLLMMAYAGLRNKRIVEMLQCRGVNAIGLSGIDGRLISGKRNSGIRIREGAKKMLLHDISGKPTELNADLITLLLERGYTPVISVPIADENGFAVNTENDEIVALLQHSLQASRVVQLIEAKGLQRDETDPESVIAQLSVNELGQWETKTEGRIKRKLHALSKLFTVSALEVYIGDGRIERPIENLLNGRGTVIR